MALVRICFAACWAVIPGWWAVALLAAQDQVDVPISQYASAEQLTAQVQEFVAGIEECLVDEPTFVETDNRVRKDAHTIAVLALALALHDEDHALKGSAASLLAASRALASAKDFAAAQESYAQVKQAASGSGDATGAPDGWSKVASQGQLMKQVAIVNNKMRRAVRSSRFEREADENAEFAAVLAVIAQATYYDTHEVKDPNQIGAWRDLAVSMRESAGDLRAAFTARDQQAAQDALKHMQTSCDRCHEVFRVEVAQ